jgi:hypothetical protein
VLCDAGVEKGGYGHVIQRLKSNELYYLCLHLYFQVYLDEMNIESERVMLTPIKQYNLA